jgi:hypothetical protein
MTVVRSPPPCLRNFFSGTETCPTLGTSTWVAIVDVYFGFVVGLAGVTVNNTADIKHWF